MRLRQLVLCMACCVMAIMSSCAMAEKAHRVTLSLEGAFADIDQYHTKQLPSNLVAQRKGCDDGGGGTSEERHCNWPLICSAGQTNSMQDQFLACARYPLIRNLPTGGESRPHPVKHQRNRIAH